MDAHATVTGYWSDGTANVELAASLRNTGNLPTDDSHRVAVTCWRAGEAIDGCGSELSISLSDGFGPTAEAVTLRVPMGEVSFRFDYGGDEPSTLQFDVPERILGVDRDVWACFSDTSNVGTAMRWPEGVGCAGWRSETILKWDQTSPVKVWADGPRSFVSIFEDVLAYLSPLLGLQFEWVPSEQQADFVAHIGLSVAEARRRGVYCGERDLGCASYGPSATGEIEYGDIAVFNVWDPESDYGELTSDAQRLTLNAVIHEAMHALAAVAHRAQSDSVMNIQSFRRTKPSPMEEALLRLYGHPLVAPGMTMEEIERLVVFSDDLIDPVEDADLAKWKLVTQAYRVLREAGSAEFRVRSSFSACGTTFGWADYAISAPARQLRHDHAGWIMVDDGSNHFYYIHQPVLGVYEYWSRSNDEWTLSSPDRYEDSTPGWRSTLSDPHVMITNVLHYADWTQAKLEIDPGGPATLRFELNTVVHGRLEVVITLDRETYVISEYGMDWELADETCERYRVEAKDGLYHDGFAVPRAIREGSVVFGGCTTAPLEAASSTISVEGTWIKHCDGASSVDGYARSYSLSLSGWSTMRIRLSSTDPTSLRILGDQGANVPVDQGGQVTLSRDYEWIWTHWAQAVVPPGRYTVEASTRDRVSSGRFGLSISTARTHEPPHTFRSISTGAYHACALESDGTAVCWGDGGELHAWPPFGQVSIMAPSGETFTQISSGAFFSCGLKRNGTPLCWGRDYDGQTTTPKEKNLVTISSGGGHTCALRKDGSPLCWGSNASGQAAPPEGERFISISSGGNHTCALRENGSPICWGSNSSGQASPPEEERFAFISGGRLHTCALREDGSPVCWGNVLSPTPQRERFVSISSGGWHTCGLREDGTPVCWGDHQEGQTSPPAGQRFTAISSGRRHTCGLSLDGSAVCWGSNDQGQMPPTSLRSGPLEADESAPRGVPAKFVSIASGRFHTCAARSDATAVCWGRNYHLPPPDEHIIFVSSGASHTCGLRENGSPVCWGNDDYGQSSWPSWTSLTNLKSISNGGFHTCVLRADLTIECWGTFGQGLPPWGQFAVLSSGGFHTCALRPDGAAVCWGHDGFGQSSAPAGERFASISSGWRHTCGLRQDGSAVCWGADEDAIDFGQASPPTDERFASISSGAWHTCALRSDGSAVCWGWDEHGQASPPSDQRFAAISSGMKHTCAITLDGIVVCWGSNEYGQLSPPTH